MSGWKSLLVLGLLGASALCQAQTRIWVQLGTGNDDLRDGSRVEVTVNVRGQRPFTQEVAGGRRWADRTTTNATLTLPYTATVEEIEKIDVKFTANRRFGMEDDKWWFVSFTARLDSATGRVLYTNRDVSHKFEADGTWTTGVLGGFDSSGQTIIEVKDEAGRAVSGARAFVGSNGLGVSDSSGQIRTGLRLDTSSELVVMARVHESGYYRSGHSAGSTRDWNYRVYLTNLRVADTGAMTPMFTLTGNRVRVTVRKDQPLVGLNFVCSVEWDVPNSDQPMWRTRATNLSAYLYNATDGQFFVERFHVIDQARGWDSSDYRVFSDGTYRANVPNITGGFLGWNVLGSAMKMSRGNDFEVYAHEFGHFGLDVRDEYKDNDPTTFCSVNASGSGPFAAWMPQTSCMMWHQWAATKICSGHATNMHRSDNRQGSTPCWDKIKSRYDSAGNWTFTSPGSRRTIPGTISLRGRSGNFSHILPIITFDSIDRPNPSPLSSVTVTVGGAPADQANVTLLESGAGGRSLYMGRINDVGMLTIGGAHRGDTLMATLADGSRSMFATVGTASSMTIAFPASPEEELFAQVQGGSGGQVNLPQSGAANPLSVVCSVSNGVTVQVSGPGVASVDSVSLWEPGKPRATVLKPTKQGSSWVTQFSLTEGEALVIAMGKGADGRTAVGSARFLLSKAPSSAADDLFGPGGILALHGFRSKVGQVFSTTEAFVGKEPAGWRTIAPMVRLTTSGGLSLSGVTMELRGIQTEPKRGTKLQTSFAAKIFAFDPAKGDWRQVPGQVGNGAWQMAAAPCPGPGLYTLMAPGRSRGEEALFRVLSGR